MFKKNTEPIDIKKQTANDLVNVQDIRDNILYTKDGHIFAYIRLTPIALDLLSEDEKKIITRGLTTELSSEQKPFKFLSISRPVDVSSLVDDMSDAYMQAEAQEQKEILKNGMETINRFVLSGDVIERQFYTIIWEVLKEDTERELLQRANNLCDKYTGCGVSAHLLNQTEVIQLCNLMANPSYSHLESGEVEPTIPTLKRGVK